MAPWLTSPWTQSLTSWLASWIPTLQQTRCEATSSRPWASCAARPSAACPHMPTSSCMRLPTHTTWTSSSTPWRSKPCSGRLRFCFNPAALLQQALLSVAVSCCVPTVKTVVCVCPWLMQRLWALPDQKSSSTLMFGLPRASHVCCLPTYKCVP